MARGGLAYGSIPEVEALFSKQLQDMDRKECEEMLRQIQRIQSFAYSALLEEEQLGKL